MPLEETRHFHGEKLSNFTSVSTRDCRSRSEDCKAGAPKGHLPQPSASAELSAPTTAIILALRKASSLGVCHSFRHLRAEFGTGFCRIWVKLVVRVNLQCGFGFGISK